MEVTSIEQWRFQSRIDSEYERASKTWISNLPLILERVLSQDNIKRFRTNSCTIDVPIRPLSRVGRQEMINLVQETLCSLSLMDAPILPSRN